MGEGFSAFDEGFTACGRVEVIIFCTEQIQPGSPPQCTCLNPQGDPCAGPRPVKAHLSVNKLPAVEGHLYLGQPVVVV